VVPKGVANASRTGCGTGIIFNSTDLLSSFAHITGRYARSAMYKYFLNLLYRGNGIFLMMNL